MEIASNHQINHYWIIKDENQIIQIMIIHYQPKMIIIDIVLDIIIHWYNHPNHPLLDNYYSLMVPDH